MTSRKMHMEERLQEKISREQADDKRGEFLILFYFVYLYFILFSRCVNVLVEVFIRVSYWFSDESRGRQEISYILP